MSKCHAIFCAYRDELEQEADEHDQLREKLATILTNTAIALKGEEPELTSWSWHDLAEVAQKLHDYAQLPDCGTCKTNKNVTVTGPEIARPGFFCNKCGRAWVQQT